MALYIQFISLLLVGVLKTPFAINEYVVSIMPVHHDHRKIAVFGAVTLDKKMHNLDKLVLVLFDFDDFFYDARRSCNGCHGDACTQTKALQKTSSSFIHRSLLQ